MRPALPLVLALGACRAPGPAVVRAEEVGVVPQSPDIQGRDGGGSARVFGRSVWTFGDTVLSRPDERGLTWHHNSVSWTADADASDGLSGFTEPLDREGLPRHLMPPSPTEQAFNDAHAGEVCAEAPCGARWAVWPGTPVWDAARQRALVFYGLIYGEPGEFGFEGVGQSLAVWAGLDEEPVRPMVDPAAEHPDLLWGRGEVGWGTAAVVDGEHLLAFGCTQDGFGHDCRLARAPAADPQRRAAWTFWDGTAWVSDPARAHVLFEAAPILEVSWCAHLDAWLAVYSPPFDAAVLARTAPALTGPWSAASVLYVAPEDEPPYDAVHHPDLAEDGGRVQYVTYSRHTTGWFGAEFPLIRVELE